jgi:chromosome segregation ATPase
MNGLTLNITDLKNKIESLVDLHKQLKADNDRLLSENENSLKVIEEQKKKIELLQNDKNELIKSKNEEHNSIISDTKIKINELVQEIDQCIALLK